MTPPTPATILLFVLFLASMNLAWSQTPDELAIVPSRIVFDDRSKGVETLTLRNRGSDTLVYELFMTNYRMTDTGTYEEISEPDTGQMFADHLIKFSPREIAIVPNAEATVRITCSRGTDREVGEYRSHLVIRLARRGRAGSNGADDDDPGYGVAVPIIVRRGELDAMVSVPFLTVDLVPSPNTNALRAIASTRLERSGSSSTYGDISIWYVRNGGSPVLVGSARGVALYTPNRWRLVRVPLQLPEGTTLQSGVLRLEYRDRTGPEGTILARIEVPVE